MNAVSVPGSEELEVLSPSCIEIVQRPLWPKGRVSASRPEGDRLETQFPQRSVVYWACSTLNHTSSGKPPPFDVVRKLRERLPAQASSSSSDRGSKLCPKVVLMLLQNGTLI
ncbi:hypothetical protein AVEN_118682-1 [Araneus ventricosus]|uniref:Uncharacterized protein n=1 Tax=Araneus ventricosus TaxID=182803 RepID=A0A4Y2AX51_ARAVE|nr:hypothetical protein AVEN_118682-1 [Araneus ventricosus]